MTKKKSGFTLIELIVVIAVLAIIAALAIPAFHGLKKQSQKRVCFANQTTLSRAYLADYAANNGAGFQPDSFMAAQGLTKVSDGVYSGYCPADGSYTVSVDSKKGSITITCSKHGGGSGTLSSLTGKNVAELLQQAIDNSSLGNYTYIDSNSVDTNDDLAQNRAKVESALNALGFSTEGTTWGIGRTGGTNLIYWTEGNLTEDMKTTGTLAIRYNPKSQKYTLVTVDVVTPSARVSNGQTGTNYPSDNYLVLDTRDSKSSYTQYQSGTISLSSTASTSFEDIYALYQQAQKETAANADGENG